PIPGSLLNSSMSFRMLLGKIFMVCLFDFFYYFGFTLAGEAAERGFVSIEIELDVPGRAIAVLADQDFGDVWFSRVFASINFIAINEHHYICVLFDGPGFAQIRELGAAVSTAVLDSAGQLGQSQHWDIEFAGE